MPVHIDEKYANLVSPRLPLFKWIGNGQANFRCPFCKDSKRSKTKKRGYLYLSKNGLIFKCHNCSLSLSFYKFISELDTMIAKEYQRDVFKFNHEYRWKEKRKTENEKTVRSKLKIKKSKELNKVTCVSDLSEDHPCKQYVRKRKIPFRYWKDLFYSDNYMKWINDFVIPNKFDIELKSDPRLIIPFRNKDKKIFAYQGRSLIQDDQAKYIAVVLDDNEDLIFGLDRCDLDKSFYIFEGPIDSFYIDNSVAVSGSNLQKFSHENGIFVFDNQPRSKELIAIINKTIKRNKDCKMIIWPHDQKEKDVGSLIESGQSKQEITKLLNQRTFTGQKLLLEFTKWKKI